MLTHLRLFQFAIFSECELSFESGMSVFTGETGVGKSLLIDAISLLMGKTGSEEWIREGCDQAIIEATFSIPQEPRFVALEPYLDASRQCFVCRKFSRGKGTVCRVNHQTLSLKELRGLMAALVTIIGQHEYMTLLDPSTQLSLLDAASGEVYGPLLMTYKGVYARYLGLKEKVSLAQMDEGHAQQRLDFLNFQIQDIEQYGFKPDQEEALKSVKKSLQHREQLKTALGLADTHVTQMQSALTHLHHDLKKLSDIDSDFLRLSATAFELESLMGDLASEVSVKTDTLVMANTLDLDDVESQLDHIFKAKQKYRMASISLLLDFLETLKIERDALLSITTDSSVLFSQFESAKLELLSCSRTLHEARFLAAQSFSVQVQSQLERLHFTSPRFEIQLTFNPDQFHALGSDSCVWHVSLNPGHALKPVHKVASGGELSRLMLAIRSVLIEGDMPPTLIFDEVDTGIGGLTANTVGQFLKEISTRSQVLCVTHLPQLAGVSDWHFRVDKSMEHDRVKTEVILLPPEARPQELIRMVGGDAVLSSLRA